MVAADHERAFAFDRPGQRAHLALEFDLVERQPRAAGGVGQDGATVLDVEPLDRDPFRIEGHRGRRPGEAARAVEPGGEFGSLQPRIRDSPLAAHQRAERELDAQGAGAHLAGVARAVELDALQHEGGDGQQARVDRPGDPELEPGQAAGAGFELAAVASPIDEERPYQRRHQRQNDRNRKSEQRCLHAVSTTGVSEARHGAACAGPSNTRY